MNRKLIFFDIDGTILSNKMGMLESTKKAISKARENGHVCVVNTGRTNKLVGQDLRSMLEFDGYIMGCGTYIEYRGEEIYHHVISPEDSQKIIDALRRNRIDCILEGHENNFHDEIDRIFTPFFLRFVLRFKEEGYGLYEDSLGKFDKFYCYTEVPEDMRRFGEELGEMVDIIDRGRGFYEVVPKGITKETGIYRLADYLGIPMEDTVAIGDGPNDLPMLQCVHTAIVMGNAPASLYEYADFVTADVDDDGIEKALRWLGVI